MGKYKYEIGFVIEDENRKITILQHTELWDNKPVRAYRVKCLKCGYEWAVRQAALQNGSGCNCCRNGVVVDGINSIADTDKWMVPWFAEQEQAHKYTYGSSKHIMAKCPQCGYSKRVRIDTLYKGRGFKCPVCSGGKSYPQRFVMQLLIQTGVVFINELTKALAPWIIGRHRYDFYLPNHNGIIQVNGAQHSDLKNKVIDEEKRSVALQNGGITNYITIDCSKSSPQFIKSQIISSGLLQLINVNQDSISWDKIQENAQKSLVKEVCSYYQNNNTTLQLTADIFHLSAPCVFTYVKTGRRLGWVTRTYKTKPKNLSNGDPLTYFVYDPDYQLVAVGVRCQDVVDILNTKYNYHFTIDAIYRIRDKPPGNTMGFHVFSHQLTNQQKDRLYKIIPHKEILPFNCYLNGKPVCMNMSGSQICHYIKDHYDIDVSHNEIIQVANGTGISGKGFYYEYAYERLRRLLDKRKKD